MAAAGLPLKPVRVLVVDDEVDFASALALRLRRRGFAAAEAYSGEEGATRVEQGDIDVVVLDLKMPGPDGIHTLRRIRRTAPGVRVIVLTGHGTVAAGVAGMQCGADDFLLKPVDLDTLCAAILTAAEPRAATVTAGGEGENQ